MIAGKPLDNAAGRQKLAQEPRDLAGQFDLARAICSDVAKLLEFDAVWITPLIACPKLQD